MESDDEESPSRRPGGESSLRSLSDLLDRTDSGRSDPNDRTADDGGQERGLDGAQSGDFGAAISLADVAEAVRDRLPASEWEWVNFGGARDGDGFGAADPEDAAIGEDETFERLVDDSNVLLEGPRECPAEFGACARLLVPDAERTTNRLFVTYGDSCEDRPAACRDSLSDVPGETVVIAVGESARSDRFGNRGEGYEMVTVPKAGDLQRLGMLVSKHLSAWEGRDADGAVCFCSLTSLLRFADRRTAFRFLTRLQNRVRAAGARAHYHIEADAHDGGDMAELRELFDATLTYDEDGSVTVRR